MRKVVIFLLLVVAKTAEPASPVELSFESFPAEKVAGRGASVIDWSSNPDSRRFSTKLKHAFARGVKFAGHYAVTTWSCGTDCQILALVDMQSGQVIFGPGAEFDYEFRSDSRLLIGNSPSAIRDSLREFGGCPGKDDYWAVTSHYYEWTGTTFKPIADVNACEQKLTQIR